MRKAFIPETWITPKLGADALRTLIAIALHADKHGVSYIKNEVLVEMLGKETRQIQIDFQKAERLGLISRKYSDKGKRYFQIHMDSCTDDSGVHGAQPECAMGRNSNAQGGAMEVRPIAQPECAPPNNPHIGTPYLSTVPFHSLAGEVVDGLPIGQPKRSTIGIEVRTELAGWLMGDEVKFVAAIDCDWSEDFIFWCIGQAKRSGIRKAAYLLAICKNNWRENWCSPVDAEKAADEASREKIRERMRNLK